MFLKTANKAKESKGVSAEDVARFFLAFGNETGETITNLKLQKLVYYAQAWYLANFGKPLFGEDFQAWVHGPVIPGLYHSYKKFGAGPIISPWKLEEVERNLDTDTKDFLNEVAKMYMPFGGYQLEIMVHKENPWIEVRDGLEADARCEGVITKDAMQKFYAEKIQDKAGEA